MFLKKYISLKKQQLCQLKKKKCLYLHEEPDGASLTFDPDSMVSKFKAQKTKNFQTIGIGIYNGR